MRNLVFFMFICFASLSVSAQSTVQGNEQVDSSAVDATTNSVDDKMKLGVHKYVIIAPDHYSTNQGNVLNAGADDKMKLATGSAGPSNTTHRESKKAKRHSNTQSPVTTPTVRVDVNNNPVNEIECDKNTRYTRIKP